jgi:hypothetical protein
MTAADFIEQRLAAVAAEMTTQIRDLATVLDTTPEEARQLVDKVLRFDAEPLRVYGPPIVRTK